MNSNSMNDRSTECGTIWSVSLFILGTIVKHRQTMLPKVTKEGTKTPRHLSKVQTVRKRFITEMIFYYLHGGSKCLGSTPLAAFQKGGMRCQKETITLSRRLDESFLGTASQMWLCLFKCFQLCFPTTDQPADQWAAERKTGLLPPTYIPAHSRTEKDEASPPNYWSETVLGRKKKSGKKRSEPQAPTPNPVFQR